MTKTTQKSWSRKLKSPTDGVYARPPGQSRGQGITVTAEDINAGIMCIASSCPISTAIRRQLPVLRVKTTAQLISFTKPKEGVRVHYLTPIRAQQFLVDYDRGASVQPFSFRLPSHAAWIQRVGKDKKRKKSVAVVKNVNKKSGSYKILVNGPPPVVGHNRRVYGLCSIRLNQGVDNACAKSESRRDHCHKRKHHSQGNRHQG